MRFYSLMARERGSRRDSKYVRPGLTAMLSEVAREHDDKNMRSDLKALVSDIQYYDNLCKEIQFTWALSPEQIASLYSEVIHHSYHHPVGDFIRYRYIGFSLIIKLLQSLHAPFLFVIDPDVFSLEDFLRSFRVRPSHIFILYDKSCQLICIDKQAKPMARFILEGNVHGELKTYLSLWSVKDNTPLSLSVENLAHIVEITSFVCFPDVNLLVELVQSKNQLVIDFLTEYWRICQESLQNDGFSSNKCLLWEDVTKIPRAWNIVDKKTADHMLIQLFPRTIFNVMYGIIQSIINKIPKEKCDQGVASYLKDWYSLYFAQSIQPHGVDNFLQRFRDAGIILANGLVAEETDFYSAFYVIVSRLLVRTTRGTLMGYGAHSSEDFSEIFKQGLKILKKASDSGHAKASFWLGLMYQYGIRKSQEVIIEKNPSLAMTYFKKAFLQGDVFPVPVHSSGAVLKCLEKTLCKAHCGKQVEIYQVICAVTPTNLTEVLDVYNNILSRCLDDIAIGEVNLDLISEQDDRLRWLIDCLKLGIPVASLQPLNCRIATAVNALFGTFIQGIKAELEKSPDSLRHYRILCKIITGQWLKEAVPSVQHDQVQKSPAFRRMQLT